MAASDAPYSPAGFCGGKRRVANCFAMRREWAFSQRPRHHVGSYGFFDSSHRAGQRGTQRTAHPELRASRPAQPLIMSWHARLALDYRLEAGRCVARFEHDGPLRILQTLYPEGDAVCHNVLVHPPGGLVAGDTLQVSVSAGAGSHGLVTTPGASRFYRSEGAPAVQDVRIHLDPGARLEWLPLEALYYSGCRAENRLRMDLAPGAELLGWDIAAL